MRYSPGIQRLQRDRRYHDAKDVLWTILHHSVPSDSQLQRVFGVSKIGFVNELISAFLESNSSSTQKPRLHVDSAPTEISTKRDELEENHTYQGAQLQLLQWQTPDRKALTQLYGEYAETVERVFTIFLELGLQRKCGVATAAHLNRVGALTGAMGIDEPPLRTYSAIAALHDCVEDLLNLALDKKGKQYGLQRYQEFLDILVPPELRSSVILLTNHYDLIWGHIRSGLTRKEKAISKKTVLAFLEVMMKRGFPELQSYLSRMHSLLATHDTGPDYYESAKWLLYRELYIHDMAHATQRMANYRTYEIKAIDISDNALGRDALAMSGRIKNLIKMDIWARKGYALKTSWGPLNNHIMELEEDALVHAEHLVIRDFLEQVSTLDFFRAALLKIQDLSPVFFVDDTI